MQETIDILIDRIVKQSSEIISLKLEISEGVKNANNLKNQIEIHQGIADDFREKLGEATDNIKKISQAIEYNAERARRYKHDVEVANKSYNQIRIAHNSYHDKIGKALNVPRGSYEDFYNEIKVIYDLIEKDRP